jgi:hypothetical protein
MLAVGITRRPLARARFTLYSDTAKEGTDTPSLGGYAQGYYWSFPLARVDCELPMPVLEFCALWGNVLVFAPLVKGAQVHLATDSLTTADVIAAASADSLLMQIVHLRLLARPEWRALAPNGNPHVGFIYSETNVMADAASRGRLDLLERLCAQIGLRGHRLDAPHALRALLDELVLAMQDGDAPPAALPAQPAAAHPPLELPLVAIARANPRLPLLATRIGEARVPGPRFRVLSRAWRTPPPAAAAEPPQARAQAKAAADAPAPRLPNSPPTSLPARAVVAAPENATFRILCRRAPAAPRARALPTGPRAEAPLRSGPPLPRAFASVTPAGNDVLPAPLASSASPLALNPRDPAMLGAFQTAIADAVLDSSALNTQSKDRTDWPRWEAFCASWGTSPLRSDSAANSGADAAGFQRESFLLASFLIHVYQHMRPRSRSAPAPKPKSALSVLSSIRRVHKQANLHLVQAPIIKHVVRGMLRVFVRTHGQEALLPERKQPLGADHLRQMLRAPHGLLVAGRCIDWAAPFWIASRALIHVGYFGAFRKAELSVPDVGSFQPGCLSRASLKWSLSGIVVAAPSAEQLRARRYAVPSLSSILFNRIE